MALGTIKDMVELIKAIPPAWRAAAAVVVAIALCGWTQLVTRGAIVDVKDNVAQVDVRCEKLEKASEQRDRDIQELLNTQARYEAKVDGLTDSTGRIESILMGRNP